MDNLDEFGRKLNIVRDRAAKLQNQHCQSPSQPQPITFQALAELEKRLEERLVHRLVDLVDEKLEQVLAKQETDLGEMVA